MKKRKKPEPELCWMAWSPDSNFLPQAASVSRAVCREMINEHNWSPGVRPVRVRVVPVSVTVLVCVPSLISPLH